MSEFLEQISTFSQKRLALLALELKTKLDALEQARTEPIAVIGMGCRYPGGADSPDAFWRLLRDGTDAVQEVPQARWDLDALYDPDPDVPGKMATRWGGFLNEIDQFDPHFFGISPREATTMDPQQRLLLEVAWEALEDSGYAPDRLMDSPTGVYVGIFGADYLRLLVAEGLQCLDTYVATGNGHSVAAGRLSYQLGLKGPSLAVDTACSASLVAVHLALQGLRNGECRMALAGGVNAILGPETTMMLSRGRAMAPDGRCKAFAAAADGYVRSEGCGLVVLKRWSDARADGDRILALLRGSAINQDGRSNGLTAPNGPSQVAVIRAALANAGIEPADVGYVETHGTGTPLGDPIEAQALAAALGPGRAPDQPLLIGSVKTNLGHLESAAGIAGLMKVILSLQHGEIPPHLHLEQPSPLIPWHELPLTIPTRLTPWPSGARRRVAGVSSFGFSGTNAHLIVEEAPACEPAQPERERPLHLLALSARDDAALSALAERYADHLATHPDQPLADVCHTANAGRAHFAHRLAVTAADTAALHARLAAARHGEAGPGIRLGTVRGADRPKVAFLFTGQGSQYAGMGRGLYETQPTFRAALDRCAALLQGELDRPLLDVLYPARPGDDDPIRDDMAYAQPAQFAVQYALAALWQAWGVQPSVLVGHSVGEYAAACVAGVFGLEEGLRLVAARGRLLQRLPRTGAMAVLFAPEARVAAALAPYADAAAIAALNSPDSVVVSGAAAAVDAVIAALGLSEEEWRRLPIPAASHSPLVEPILDEFERVAATIQYRPPRTALVSTLTGRLAEDGDLTTPAYWRRHLRQAVRFAPAMRELQARGCELFVEIGPHPTLLGMAQRCLGADAGAWLPSLRQGQDDWEQILDSLSDLYIRGAAVDWAGFDRDYPRRKVSLPTYPFQRRRYWYQVSARPRDRYVRRDDDERAPRSADEQPGAMSPNMSDWLYEIRWEPSATPAAPPPAAPDALRSGPWLIFADGGGVGEALAQLLVARGNACTLVRPGEAYRADGSGRVQLRPAAPEDMRRLFDEASQAGMPAWSGIVHLWSLDAPELTTTGAAAFETAQTLACASILPLVQQVMRGEHGELPGLWLVTRGAQPVLPGQAPVAVSQAPVAALASVITAEHSDLPCVCVDLDPAGTADDARRLLAELAARDAEDRVAWRGGARYVPRLVRTSLLDSPAGPTLPGAPAAALSPERNGAHGERASGAHRAPPRDPAAGIRPDATYLITGGLGALGLVVARWLVAQGARHLALVGRTEGSETARETVSELRQRGAQVVTLRADISQEEQVRALLAEIARTMPPLRGILHLANVLDDGVILQQDRARLLGAMRPKALGAWHLHALTRQLPLDFFVLFSSAAAFLGSPGLVPYATANAFLDALAHLRQAEGLPATSINWGAWLNLGLAAGVGSFHNRRWVERGISYLRAEQGVDLLSRILCQGMTQISVLPIDWQRFLAPFRPGTVPPLFTDFAAQATAGSAAHPADVARAERLRALAAAAEAERHDLISACLRDQVVKVLGLTPGEPLDAARPLNEFGLDSIMAIELRNRIELELGVRLPVSAVLSSPSLAQLAANVARHWAPPPTTPATVESAAPADSTSPPQGPDGGDGAAMSEASLADLLASLDDASDEQVAVLLDAMLAEKEVAS